MANKRKRKQDPDSFLKRQRVNAPYHDASRRYAVLRCCYTHVQSLREYLQSSLSGLSRKRRRHVAALKAVEGDKFYEVADLLDKVVIGCNDGRQAIPNMVEDLQVFTQRQTGSIDDSTLSSPSRPVAEIIDYVIYKLFQNDPGYRQAHLLCHGRARSKATHTGDAHVMPSSIHGLVDLFHNPHVAQLKTRPWTLLPDLLGNDTERVLVELLMGCGIYRTEADADGPFFQISGQPMTELPRVYTKPETASKPTSAGSLSRNGRAAASMNLIRFARHCILYGKPIFDKHGKVKPGLRPTHILNRVQDMALDVRGPHMLCYVFPRQYRLPNVFDARVARRDKFCKQDNYTSREDDIARLYIQPLDSYREPLKPTIKVPRRLRGTAVACASSMASRHASMSYLALLQYYCPKPCNMSRDSLGAGHDVALFSSTLSQVSSFCRAAVDRVFPSKLWGCRDNYFIVHRWVDAFVGLQRFDTVSLHSVLRDIKVSTLAWLQLPGQQTSAKLALSDVTKRQELLAELIFYLFDSFLIPLISSNFYVTESAAHRQQLFYFRHDVWLQLSRPAMRSLISSTFVRVPRRSDKQSSTGQLLAGGRVRLLPKSTGLRPLVNLGRPVLTRINGRNVLGKSVNNTLRPAFDVLNYEKFQNPSRLGASMFSPTDMFDRLRRFKQSLAHSGQPRPTLFFAKVDVESCFDSIPHRKLLQLIEQLYRHNDYAVKRHSRAKVTGHRGNSGYAPRVIWKYRRGIAQPLGSMAVEKLLSDDACEEQVGEVVVDSGVHEHVSKHRILQLLEKHINGNLVEIDKNIYRQTTGIPQGSIVSAILCSYFYADMEEKSLAFVRDGESLMLRLIDDFLLVTPSRDTAMRFIATMHDGLPDYGIRIKPAKTLVNFDCDVDGLAIARVASGARFPYCGYSIGTTDLSITKDMARQGDAMTAVAMEHSSTPGQSFYRKMMSMLSLHTHSMLLSTRANGTKTVQSNLYNGFEDMARKMLHYCKHVSRGSRPTDQVISKTIMDIVEYACSIMQRKRSKQKRDQTGVEQDFDVACESIRRIGYMAFMTVFERRRSQHAIVCEWLRNLGTTTSTLS